MKGNWFVAMGLIPGPCSAGAARAGKQKAKHARLALSALTLAMLSTSVSAQEVTLRFWDNWSDQSDAIDAMIDAFEQANPDIRIERSVQTFEDFQTVIQTALNAGTGPDVMVYSPGPAFAGTLIDAGLLLPLDDMFAEGGALDHIYGWAQERTTVDGVNYGVGHEVEFLGVYYNRDLFERPGLTEPKTYEEFLEIAAALKGEGLYPVTFGNAAGWPAYHTFSMYANNAVSKSELEAMINGQASWDRPEIVDAIQKAFVDLQEQGFLSPTPNAVSYDDASSLFVNGQAAMNMTGSWMIRRYIDNDFETGFFFLPAAEGETTLPPAGLGSSVNISAKTAHPVEAKRFVAFMFAPENAHFWIEGARMIPAYDFDPSQMDVPGLFKFAIDAIADYEMGFNIDVMTTARFNETMSNGFQAVLAGDRTAAEQATALEAASKQ
jgi:raffinose/stachyose/melibiose transport system substrate-binding protein